MEAQLPLVIQLPVAEKGGDEAVELRCTSWRTAGEANNLAPCQDAASLRRVPHRHHTLRPRLVAGRPLARAAATGDATAADATQAAWVFDVDGTLLSNLPYYAQHGYGLELFDHREFDRWVETWEAPTIPSSLRQDREVCDLGFKTFLLTGRRVVCSFLIECPVRIIARYAANKSMDGCAFCNADGDFLTVPQQGSDDENDGVLRPKHVRYLMDKPGDKGAPKHQMIDCYIHTLAKVLRRYPFI
ncbi:hypothetical protein ZWY2020_049126 [Hordeum vulgare]|nr:hypothetical protein ZWY2020_049126 [Hordeum vulgare]